MMRYCLKSNMDRFIATENVTVNSIKIGLKSNMDRFIAAEYRLQQNEK